MNQAGRAYWVVVGDDVDPGNAAVVITAGITEELNYTAGTNLARASGNKAITATAGIQTIEADIIIGNLDHPVDVYVVLSDNADTNRSLAENRCQYHCR